MVQVEWVNRRNRETVNASPIRWEVREVFKIEDVEYASVVVYTKGRIYFTSNERVGTRIISASFTGWVPRQNILYVKDLTKGYIGGIGLILPVSDIDIPLQIVNEYNRMVNGEVFNIPKAGELDDMFTLEDK